MHALTQVDAKYHESKRKEDVYLAQGSIKGSRRRWNLELGLEKCVDSSGQ